MDPTPTFTISQSQSGSVRVLQLSGVLDESAGSELARCTAGASRLVLDLSGLRYASSTGIGAIVTLHKRLQAGGGILVLAHPSDALSEILVTLNLSAIIPVHDTVERGVLAALVV